MYDQFKPGLTRICAAIGVGTCQDVIGALIAFAATVFFASLLYRTFEMPFLRLKRRFTFVPSRD